MADETSSVLDRPGGDAESALAAAARHLRASPRPTGATQAREREIFRGRQVRDLLAWARENTRLISPATYERAERGGEEHSVWLDESLQLYFKATFPGRFGFGVAVTVGGEPDLVAATPLEYLERLLLQNRVFGDELRLVGVAEDQKGVVVVTSQPNVEGGDATREEILDFMRSLWFRPLPGLHLGNPGALAFYRDLDELAAFDAHPANFVKDQNGVILPIDLILVQADKVLQAALGHYLG